jgi:hypothetical protein
MNTTRKLTVLVAACLAACVVAACGSSSSSSSASSSSAASGGTAASAVRSKFVTCLKAHGVTLPAFRGRPGGGPGGGAGGGGAPPSGSGTAGAGGTPPPGGFRGPGGRGGGFFQRFRSNPKMQAAFKACAADLPKGGFRGGRFGGGFGGRPQRAAITKFVTCIRSHGYNLPAPNLSGKGPVFPSKIESNAKFQAASRSCRNLLVPQGAGSGSGGGSSA